jgi:hypothetical membrane protein
MLRYSGVLAVLVLWVVIPAEMHHIGLHLFDVHPISYLGVDPRTRALFSSALIISALLMICFGVEVKKRFRASNGFLIALVIGQLCQIITALVPDKGSIRPLHSAAAYLIAISLPLLLWRFVRSQPKDRFGSINRALFAGELIAMPVGILLFVLVSGVGPFGEILTVVFFHLWVLFMTTQWHPKGAVKARLST